MPASTDTTFTIFLKTIADATGLTDLKNSVSGLQSSFATLKTTLEAVGLGLTLQQLDAYGKKALEVREQQAAFVLQVLRSKDGSAELVTELNNLNRELADTTGTSEQSSRAIERQLLLFGATRDQVKALTVAIIDFAAARGRDPNELAFVISRALAGEDIMLNRLGLHLDKEKSHVEQINELISQMGKTSGTAAAIEEASGGMGKLEVQTERARIAIGNLVNIVKIPFLTGLAGDIGSVKGKVDELTASTDSWSFKFALAARIAGESIRNIFNVVDGIWAAEKVVLASIQLLVVGAVATVENAVETLVTKAIDKLSGLAKTAASLANVLSSGLINIDDSRIDAAFDGLKSKVTGAGDSMRDTWKNSLDQIQRDFDEGLKDLQKATDAMGPKLFSPEFRKQVEEQFKSLFGNVSQQLQNVAKPGTGFITGDDSANREKAATDALSNAKFRLTAAQQSYELALEKTKALEDAGAISSDQANQQRATAIRNYIAQLNQIRSTLPAVISQLEAMGKTEGANELRTELGKVDIQILKLKTDLSNLSFLGQLRSQIRQLASEWSNLGKQLGGFVNQQFQNLAQTGGQVISDLLFRTGNLKQSILQLGQSFVASLAQMLIQWILARTVMSALNKAFGAADASAASGQASGAAAAWAPAATSASIASYGTAAGLGLTAYLSALSAGTAGAVAASAAHFLGGGWTGGREGKFAGVVHGEEFVVRAPAVRKVGLGILNAINSGAMSFAKPGYLNGGFVGPGSGGIALQRPVNANDLKVEIYNFTDIHQLNDAWSRSPAGRKILNRHIRKNRQ